MQRFPGTTKHVSQGFTLIELLVTIALASILMALAVPSFNSFVVSSKLAAQTNEIVAAINFARSEAIRGNGNVSFCRASSDTATACATTADAWLYWIVRTPAGTVTRRGIVNASLSVRSTLDTDQAIFGSDGRARTGTALINDREISICAASQTTDNIRKIVLGSASRMTVTSASGGC